jgi:hypothetical protein
MLGVVWPPGLHKKVPPGNDGVAVKVELDPLQMVSFNTITVGTGFTVTVPVTAAF